MSVSSSSQSGFSNLGNGNRDYRGSGKKISYTQQRSSKGKITIRKIYGQKPIKNQQKNLD